MPLLQSIQLLEMNFIFLKAVNWSDIKEWMFFGSLEISSLHFVLMSYCKVSMNFNDLRRVGSFKSTHAYECMDDARNSIYG